MKLFSKLKIVIIIGDNGTIVSLLDGKKLLQRLFVASTETEDSHSFSTFLSKYNEVPIYILLDTIDQTYTQQSLPGVSSMSIGKLVKKRLERDFAESDLKGAIQIKRQDGGRRDWLYMFVSTPQSESLLSWIELITKMNSRIMGIFLLPLEMERFVKNLNKIIFKDDKEKSSWQFLVTHNKSGGFRQIITHNGSVVFTRLIRQGKDTLPDILAGNIEQEIFNTIDYIRRLSFDDHEEIDVIAIVSKEIKKGLKTTNIRGRNLLVYTPFEIAEKLGFVDVATLEDKFSDILLTANFINSKVKLKLNTKLTEKLQTLHTIQKYIGVLCIGVIPFTLAFIGYFLYQIIGISSEIEIKEKVKMQVDRELSAFSKTDSLQIEDIEKIADSVAVYTSINENKVLPLKMVKKMIDSQKGYAFTESINWSVNEKSKSNSAGNQVTFVFNMNFYNSGSNIDELFRNFDEFTSRIRENFSDYSVEHSRLPQRIDPSEFGKEIGVQVTVSTQKEGQGRR